MYRIDRPLVYKLVKAGYGTFNDIIGLPVDVVLDMVAYESFTSEYESILYERIRESYKDGRTNNY